MTTPSPSFSTPRSATSSANKQSEDCQTPSETGISFEATQSLPQALEILGELQGAPELIEALLYVLLGDRKSPWQDFASRIIVRAWRASVASVSSFPGTDALAATPVVPARHRSLGPENHSPNDTAVRLANAQLALAVAEADLGTQKRKGTPLGAIRGPYNKRVKVPAGTALLLAEAPAQAARGDKKNINLEVEVIARSGTSESTIAYERHNLYPKLGFLLLKVRLEFHRGSLLEI